MAGNDNAESSSNPKPSPDSNVADSTRTEKARRESKKGGFPNERKALPDNFLTAINDLKKSTDSFSKTIGFFATAAKDIQDRSNRYNKLIDSTIALQESSKAQNARLIQSIQTLQGQTLEVITQSTLRSLNTIIDKNNKFILEQNKKQNTGSNKVKDWFVSSTTEGAFIKSMMDAFKNKKVESSSTDTDSDEDTETAAEALRVPTLQPVKVMEYGDEALRQLCKLFKNCINLKPEKKTEDDCVELCDPCPDCGTKMPSMLPTFVSIPVATTIATAAAVAAAVAAAKTRTATATATETATEAVETTLKTNKQNAIKVPGAGVEVNTTTPAESPGKITPESPTSPNEYPFITPEEFPNTPATQPNVTQPEKAPEKAPAKPEPAKPEPAKPAKPADVPVAKPPQRTNPFVERVTEVTTKRPAEVTTTRPAEVQAPRELVPAGDFSEEGGRQRATAKEAWRGSITSEGPTTRSAGTTGPTTGTNQTTGESVNVVSEYNGKAGGGSGGGPGGGGSGGDGSGGNRGGSSNNWTEVQKAEWARIHNEPAPPASTKITPDNVKFVDNSVSPTAKDSVPKLPATTTTAPASGPRKWYEIPKSTQGTIGKANTAATVLGYGLAAYGVYDFVKQHYEIDEELKSGKITMLEARKLHAYIDYLTLAATGGAAAGGIVGGAVGGAAAPVTGLAGAVGGGAAAVKLAEGPAREWVDKNITEEEEDVKIGKPTFERATDRKFGSTGGAFFGQGLAPQYETVSPVTQDIAYTKDQYGRLVAIPKELAGKGKKKERDAFVQASVNLFNSKIQKNPELYKGAIGAESFNIIDPANAKNTIKAYKPGLIDYRDEIKDNNLNAVPPDILPLSTPTQTSTDNTSTIDMKDLNNSVKKLTSVMETNQSGGDTNVGSSNITNVSNNNSSNGDTSTRDYIYLDRNKTRRDNSYREALV
jgi:hypothetical protein